MAQMAEKGFEKHNRTIRNVEFLARMESIVSWVEVCVLIKQHSRKWGLLCDMK